MFEFDIGVRFGVESEPDRHGVGTRCVNGWIRTYIYFFRIM